MNRACAVALLALMSTAIAACGSAAGDAAAPPTASTIAANDGRRLMSRAPSVGVACPRANSIACNRVGVAVWLKRPAARVIVTIGGRSVRLHRGRPDGRESWYQGYMQPAGLLSGPLKVTPDRGRSYWQGGHPKDVRLRLVIRQPGGATRWASLVVPLRPGWG